MGSVNTKEVNSNTNTDLPSIPPSLLERKSRQTNFMSPLHKSITAAMDDADPRSPSCKRTPVHTPFSTPPLNGMAYRDRVLTRLGSASKFPCEDPRSPGSQRTPVANGASYGKPTPPPFSLGLSYGDPRSPTPFLARTPLALSTQEAEVVNDVVVAEEVIMRASVETPVKLEKAEKIDLDVVVVESSTVVESTSHKTIREVFSSPEYSISPAIMALTISPLSSPALGRKRKPDLVLKYNNSLSPLKKSFSAPDENTPPSLKLSAMIAQNNITNNKGRTPLSPLSTRAINSRCMDVQPIKFRMEPGILG